MIVLVCGGRAYDDDHFVFSRLDRLHKVKPITLIVHGDANGADKLSGRWAEARGIRVAAHAADWDAHGIYEAGKIRNQHMLDTEHPDMVVAFPGGGGTADMVRRSIAAGLYVWKPEEAELDPALGVKKVGKMGFF